MKDLDLPCISNVLDGTDTKVYNFDVGAMYAVVMACVYEISADNALTESENFLRFVMKNMTPEFAILAGKQLSSTRISTRNDINPLLADSQTFKDFVNKYYYLVEESQ
jgi:hypothetical protein